MCAQYQIRLLASTNNARGDLFTRLMQDLFFALGYENLRLDVHKSGRELDISGQHRHEPRLFIAECKAHAKAMGGEALNKFFGVLGRERSKAKPRPVTGYFISLGGFTETGREQENETGDDRAILLGAEQVIAELQQTKLLISEKEAAEAAGRCAASCNLKGLKLDGFELLGHDQGYLWAVYYSQGKKRSHLALVHADGTPLSVALAREVIEIDRQCKGALCTLTYLAPAGLTPDSSASIKVLKDIYLAWLKEECGYIQLDGLPADSDLSATRLRLESLFVPLRITVLKEERSEPEANNEFSATAEKRGQADEKIEMSIGQLISKEEHLALLAAPGGGKSTLLKRLAMAYAYPDRLVEVEDHLPTRDWLPLFLRCRELRHVVHRPILEILDNLARHAGMNGREVDTFNQFLHEELRAGRALLLVDGLDEISDEGERRIFAQHLRTFLGMFPKTALVATSRYTGFREVAGVMASACKPAQIAPLDRNDVHRLCEAWHFEVVGKTDKIIGDARKLAKDIWANERVRALAKNPLLLTTLLVVKRWIGELPRSRAALYQEAIRVLIRTWNVEGFAPLDESETLAQLSYIACSMMQQGKQRIGESELLRLLHAARKELEEELGYVDISPAKFIARIEYRSSLLMQTGQERHNGILEPVYEFRHLTFQEYLAARGFVNEQYPGRGAELMLADLLAAYFENENWREIIPLAAAIAQRKADGIVQKLVLSLSEQISCGKNCNDIGAADVLTQCLLDEVQAKHETIVSALRLVGQRDANIPGRSDALALRHGKFGIIFRDEIENIYQSGGLNWDKYISSAAALTEAEMLTERRRVLLQDNHSQMFSALTGENRITSIRAIFTCMHLAYSNSRYGILRNADKKDRRRLSKKEADTCGRLRDLLVAKLDCNDPPVAAAACWALAWFGEMPISPPTPEQLASILRIWRLSNLGTAQRFAPWAFASQPLLSRDALIGIGDISNEWILEQLNGEQNHKEASLTLSWYLGYPWNDEELVKLIFTHSRDLKFSNTPSKVLTKIGFPDNDLLDQWNNTVHDGENDLSSRVFRRRQKKT